MWRRAAGRTALGLVVALAAGTLAAVASVAAIHPAQVAAAVAPMYDATPSPLPPSVPGQNFESLSLSEVGDQIGLAGSNRALGTVAVTVVSYGCQSGYWYNDTCTTTPGSTFSVPITFNVYNTGPGNTPGSLIATRTQTFTLPYRPSDDDVNCPPANDSGNGRWFDASTSTCNRGLAANISFDFSQQGVTLPNHLVYGVAFNTTDAGNNPVGTGAACFSGSGGCGYDFLYVGLSSTAPSAGTDEDPTTIFQNSSVAGTYCDNGTAGTGTFRVDSPGNGCWGGTTPAVQFNPRQPQTLVVASANNCPNANFSTIQSAVDVAMTGDTISVCAGAYPELVQVTTPGLTIRGAKAGVDARSGRTASGESILDGTGPGAGFLVNADNVTIDGFTIQNNASALNAGAAIETLPAHSGYTLVNNVIQRNVMGVYANSSGALASLIQHNLFRNNNHSGANSGNGIYTDQGSANITVDANSFMTQTAGSIVFAAPTSPGEHGVTVTSNMISDAAASFASVTGLSFSGNNLTGTSSGGVILAGGDSFTSVDNNVLQANAGPGVQVCNCLGAGYAANGRSVSVTNNTILGDTNGIEVDAGGASNSVAASFNRIAGNTGSGAVNNAGQTLNAADNWWGCNGGPGTAGCDQVTGSGTTVFSPWLVLTVTSSRPKASAPVTIKVDANHDNTGASTAALGNIPDGTVVSFATTVGTLNNTSAALSTGTASVTLSPLGAFGQATVTATLDGQASTVQVGFFRPSLSINSVSMPDGSSGVHPMTFTVALSSPTDTTVSVSYATADGTATSSAIGIGNPDYDATTGTLTFAPGVTSQTLSVMVHGFPFNEPVEKFTVNLFNPSSNAIIWAGTGTGSILNDDPFPKVSVTGPPQQVFPGRFASFAVNLSTPSDQTVTVNFATADGTAAANSDYKPIAGVLTFTPGITTLFVYVRTVIDKGPDSSESFYLVISKPTMASLGTPPKATATIRSH